jgi:hypothetical protein
MFFDTQGRLRSMLTSWTSLAGEDAFTQVSAGRSWFRIDDLLRLVALLDGCGKPDRPRWRRVKKITPHA